MKELKALRKSLDSLMKVSKAQEAVIIDGNNMLSLTVAERDELKVNLCMLYGGLLQEAPDMPARLGRIKRMFNCATETGTYPGVWSHPILRPLAQRNWSQYHEFIAKQLNTDLAIGRDIHCPKCHTSFRCYLPWSVDAMPCVSCGNVIKW